MNKKLIYILNQYSDDSVLHFYHIKNLLIKIADQGVKILLIIEKCDEIPQIDHDNIKIILQKHKRGLKRALELFNILHEQIKNGYRKIFIRITLNATIVSIIAARVYGAKTYYWQSGTTYEVDKNKTFLLKIKWWLFNYSKFWFVKEFTDYFVTGPESMIDYYVNVVKVKKKKMILLYNDIDIKRFTLPTIIEKQALKKELNLGVDSKLILMVHRLSPVRKTDLYIPYIFEGEEINEFNAYLFIIGDGPEKEILTELIKNSEARDRIIMLGPKPNSEIQKYYKAADVFINPSYTEGFPRVIIEAMACGLPIVATDAGGTIDIFGEKQKKYIVDKNCIEDFKKALCDILSNEDEIRELSEENLEIVKKYSTEDVSKMYIERLFNVNITPFESK